MGAVGVGLELLGSAEARSGNRAAERDQKASQSNDDSLFAALRYSGKRAGKKPVGAEASEPRLELIDQERRHIVGGLIHVANKCWGCADSSGTAAGILKDDPFELPNRSSFPR
jgi:hypothetical protein